MFATKIGSGEDMYYELKPAGYAALIAAIIILLILVAILANSAKKTGSTGAHFNTRQLVFAALAMALAVVTSYMKLIHLPMGGSVTLLSMLFITLIGYWFGLKVGLTAAIAYGLLQLILDPYIISVPQLFVDYIFAFGALGISGIFSNQKNGLIKGYLAGVFGRYVFAVLSGFIFFGSYASYYNMSPLIYSIVYNGAYIGLEAVITLVVLAVPAVSNAFSQVKQMATN